MPHYEALYFRSKLTASKAKKVEINIIYIIWMLWKLDFLINNLISVYENIDYVD